MDIWITVTSIIRFNPLFMNIQLSWLSHFHVDRKHKKEHALDEWSWTRLKEGEHWFFSPHPLVNPLCGATCQVAWLTAITTRCSGSYNWTTPTEATCLSPWFCWLFLRSVVGNPTYTYKTFFSSTFLAQMSEFPGPIIADKKRLHLVAIIPVAFKIIFSLANFVVGRLRYLLC